MKLRIVEALKERLRFLLIPLILIVGSIAIFLLAIGDAWEYATERKKHYHQRVSEMVRGQKQD